MDLIEKNDTKETIYVWLGIALFFWLAFMAAFGVAGDLVPDQEISTPELVGCFGVMPFVCLLWPLWIQVFVGKPKSDT